MLFLSLNSCQREENIDAIAYKEGKNINTFSGLFYTTKYGGLNYYIPNSEKRNALFEIKNIDSIVFAINSQNYTAKSLVRKSFSRERNDSDFSFDIDGENHKIIPDLIENMNTLLLYSEKTNMEKMKKEGMIKTIFIGEERTKK